MRRTPTGRTLSRRTPTRSTPTRRTPTRKTRRTPGGAIVNIVLLLHGIEAEEDRPTPFCIELKPKKTGQHLFPPLTGANTFVVLTTFF